MKRRVIKRRGVKPHGARKIKRRIFAGLDKYTKRRLGVFNRHTRRVILEALRVRLPITRACELAGINPVTYYRWLEYGLQEGKPHHAVFCAFRKKVMAVRSLHEAEALDIIRAAGEGGDKVFERKVRVIKGMGKKGGDGEEVTLIEKTRSPIWQASAWFLERCRKDDYSRWVSDLPDDKSAEEFAAEVKEAADTLFNSVPQEGGANV